MSEYIIWESDGIEVQGHRVTQHEKREEIVRCRDCKHFHANTNGMDCPKLDPDGFCAWGEREDGDAR